MKRVTIKDVAARAGVSFATVSRALSDHADISEATKNRVRAVCDELGYVPNTLARGLVQQRTHTLGLVVTDISNPFFSEIALAVERTAREHGYQLVLGNSCRSAERELEVAEQFARLQVDGLIVSCLSPASQKKLVRALPDMPCVFLGSNHDGACSFVTVDNALGAYEGVRYLNCLGNRRIVYLGGRSDSMTSKERTTGFWRAVQELGLDGQEYPCPPELSDNDRTDQLIRQFFRESDLPDAIFAYSDRFAFSVMQEAEARHIRIPEDVSLLGFDNVYFSALPRIKLTTISHHKKELGRLTTERMLARLAGDDEEFHDILRPELIIRSTCGKPKLRRK